MFSQKVEYALRAVVHLAHEAPNPQTVEQIARVTKVPQAYLAKVVQELVHTGLLRSQRGIGGGISMVKTPDQLTLLEVVNAVDPIHRIETCPLDLASHGVRLCPLHRKLDNALALVEEAFRTTTLADVLSQPGENKPLCDVPVTPLRQVSGRS
jgi:Rrf2 family nitric oxide-sensitive transcriptional repressor